MKKFIHEDIVLLLANKRKAIASMNKQSYEEALQERGSDAQRGKDDAWSFALSTLHLHMMTQARLNHMMIHDGSWIVQTFEDIVKSWAYLVNPTAEDCHCIFQVTYGWFDIHDWWEYALEEKFMTEQSIE